MNTTIQFDNLPLPSTMVLKRFVWRFGMTRILFAARIQLFLFSVLLTVNSNAVTAQDEKTSTKAPRKFGSNPLINELAKNAKSWDSSIATASIRSLREFTKVRSSRLSNNAKEAMLELHNAATKWGKPFVEPSLKHFMTFKEVDILHNDLINVHILRPKAIAFVSMPRLDDYEITVFDQLDSLENLTLEDCRLIEGHGFRATRLPNLRILHLNGCDIDDSSLRYFNRKNLPKLSYINLTNTNVSSKGATAFKQRMEAKGVKIQLKLNKDKYNPPK